MFCRPVTALLNVAVTLLFAPTVTLQVVLVPVQAPDHPPKVFIPLGLSLSVTDAPCLNVAEQIAPAAVEQLMPAGLLVTVPVPFPANVTVMPVPCVNDAVTLIAALIVTVQTPVPVQPPLHPPKK